MREVKRSALVSQPPARVYTLINDIERYPEFLPWCSHLVIRSRREEAGKTTLIADMTISFKIVRETFTSKVVLDPAARRIDVAYINGPFRYLTNIWRFDPEADGGCAIDFFIDFEFRSRALGALIGAVFHLAIEKLVAAFEARAKELHRYPSGAEPRPV